MHVTSSASLTAAPRPRVSRRRVAASALPATEPPTAVVVAPQRQEQRSADFTPLTAPSVQWTAADAAAAPPVAPPADATLPEGQSWRYSEFITAVTKGKVERVRFAKDGGALQLTAVDGCVPLSRLASQGLAKVAGAPSDGAGVARPAGAPRWWFPTTPTWLTYWPRTAWTSPSQRATHRATLWRCSATFSSRCSPSAASSSSPAAHRCARAPSGRAPRRRRSRAARALPRQPPPFAHRLRRRLPALRRPAPPTRSMRCAARAHARRRRTTGATALCTR